jgi:MFS transporter, PPP family, 3-phenylpropionic acid transporter
MTVLHKFAELRASHDVAIRLSGFYVAVFMIVGSYVSFLPLWLADRGVSPTQISLIYAMPVLLRPVFTTLLSFFADRSGRHVWVLKILALGAFLSVAVLPFGGGFPVIFAAFTLFALFWTTVIPLTDAVALSVARRGAADYGRMRLWGSLSYIAVTVAGGAAVGLFGPPAALWLFIGSAACVLLMAQFLPDMQALNGAPQALRSIRLADLTALMRLPALWLFLAATSAVQATHAVYYLFGTIHWTGIGISPAIVGLLWGVSVISEIVLFAYGARVARVIGPVQLIIIGSFAAVLRWTLTSLDPPLPALFVLQLLHGLTFGASYLGAMNFMTRAFPLHLAATGQGLYASFSAGVAMGSAYLAAGPLYRAFGASAYLSMAAVGAVALCLALALLRRWDGGLLSAPERG